MKDACQRYLEEPEAYPGHLVECAECRALFDALGLPVEGRPVNVGALPLAAWEGASHRSWPLAVAGGLLVLVVAAAVCAWAGVPPLRVVQSSMASMQQARGFITGVAAQLRQASIEWQVAFGLLFVAVNAGLVFLLRRAPRGIDA